MLTLIFYLEDIIYNLKASLAKLVRHDTSDINILGSNPRRGTYFYKLCLLDWINWSTYLYIGLSNINKSHVKWEHLKVILYWNY